MGLSRGGMPSVLPKAPCRSCIFPIEPNMCAFSRKRLCIFTQTFASVVSNVCIGGFKRLHWWFQTFASAVSNVCVQIDQKSGMGVCPVHSGQIGDERDVVPCSSHTAKLSAEFLIATNLMCEERRG